MRIDVRFRITCFSSWRICSSVYVSTLDSASSRIRIRGSRTTAREIAVLCFEGVGLGGTQALSIEGEALDGVRDAVEFIARLREADDLSTLAVGRKVVVIGGGNTAIDIAVQSKRLGAEDVTIALDEIKFEHGVDRYDQECGQRRRAREY